MIAQLVAPVLLALHGLIEFAQAVPVEPEVPQAKFTEDAWGWLTVILLLLAVSLVFSTANWLGRRRRSTAERHV